MMGLHLYYNTLSPTANSAHRLRVASAEQGSG